MSGIPSDILEALHNNELEMLNLFNKGLTDADAIVLANALCGQNRIEEVHLHRNDISSEEGLVTLIEKLAELPNLTTLTLDSIRDNPRLEIAFNNAFASHKNLLGTVKTFVSDFADTARQTNYERVIELADKLSQPGLEPPETWFAILERKPAIQKHFSSRIHTDEKRSAIMTDLADFEEFLDDLPQVETSAPQAAYSALAEGQYGEEKETAFNNPRTWENLPEIITGLNRAGLHLRGEALLHNGMPSPLLHRACETGTLPALFTEQNWRGASLTELNGVLKAIPEAFQDQLTNRHTLRASVRQAETLRHSPSI